MERFFQQPTRSLGVAVPYFNHFPYHAKYRSIRSFW
jgi:hypothetical protein